MKKTFEKKILKSVGSLVVIALLMNFQVYARDSESTRKGTSLYPLYWTAYEPCYTADAPLSEARWKDNIDWVAENLLQYGYNMVTTDGWLGGSTHVNSNGYLLKYNDNWVHDWAYWVDYAVSKGLEMGVYYNPLWVADQAVSNPNVKIVGTSIPVANIYTGGWADVTKNGAEQYIKGYVNYFKDMGIRFLRVDFLCWYESGAAAGAPPGSVAFGSDNYATALRWIAEAAGDDMEVSIVMPNSFNHANNEILYGDFMRIDTDCTNGDWVWLNRGSFGDERQTWNSGFCQWANPFQGFTGFSDVAGRGNLTLDGDFMRIHNFSGNYADNEKKTAISLFTMAGAPIAVADQYDTLGSGNLEYYINPNILALKKEGFVGKPIYYNGNPFEPQYSGQPDTGSRDSERWVGQTSKGEWVVALFNRSDLVTTKSIDFSQILGITSGGYVYDIWNKNNMGIMTSYSTLLEPHSARMLKITPLRENSSTRYEAEVASYRKGAHFNNDHVGKSGMGFVDRLSGSYPNADVIFGVYANNQGTYDIKLRYANATGGASTGKIHVKNIDGDLLSNVNVTFPNLSSWDNWGDVHQNLELDQGLNLIIVSRQQSDVGAFNLDYIEVAETSLINGGFEDGGFNGWTVVGTHCGVDNSDACSGNYKCYFWNSAAFDQRIEQSVTLPNGTYRVSARTKQYSGVPSICRMEITNYGGADINMDIPHSDDYEYMSDVVTVTNGQLKIGFYEQAIGSANLQIDDVSIVSCKGVENYGFESGDITDWQATGGSYGVDQTDVHQGEYKCYFWNSGSYSQKLEQTVTGISNGLHTVKAWVKQNSGVPNLCRMEVSDYGGPINYSNVPHGDNYTQISVTVFVTNGQLKVAFYEQGTACNLQIDDIYIE